MPPSDAAAAYKKIKLTEQLRDELLSAFSKHSALRAKRVELERQLEKLDAKQIHAPWLAPSMTLEMAGITLGKDYPAPIVQHDEARKKTLARYAVVKKS